MACEEYRNGMMALLDGELPAGEKVGVEHHLQNCPHCMAEYQRFEQLTCLTSFTPPSLPFDFSWQLYYRGVCRKMETRATWASWSFVSLLLISTGTLMFFSAPQDVLAVTIGLLAIACGCATTWLSYFCSCGTLREKH